MATTPPRRLLLSLAFCASGAAALLFETLWFRLAGLTFGNGVRAASLVLTSLMAGLALGNALAARLGDRVRRPLRAYAMVEAAIGVTGLGLVLLFPELTALLAPLFRRLATLPLLLDAARFAIAGLLLLVPTAAMGATLPLMLRAASAPGAPFGGELGRLYGWNTLGAVAGALLGEMFLIRWLGLRGTGGFAAALSLTASALAWRLAGAAVVEEAGAALPTLTSRRAARLLAAAFLSGAILLALELVWFRLLLLYVHGTSLGFAVMLAVVLAGIASGGFLGSLRLRRSAGADLELPLPALLAGVAVVVGYAGFDALPVFGNRLLHEPGPIAVLALWLMFPGSLLSGYLFTLLGAALQARLGGPARTAGWLTLANTVGAALGAVLGGFLLLPGLGVERSFFALAAAYLAVAGLCASGAALRAGRNLAAAAALLAVLVAYPFGLMQGRHLRAIRDRFGGAAMTIEEVREGVAETIVYLRRELWGEAHHHQLVTNGLSMSGSPLSAKRYMKQYVYWPLAANPRIRRALLICYGVGSTAKALTDSRGLAAIDVVDLSEGVLDLAGVVYPQPGTSPLDDPRVRRHVEDGRFFLETSTESYDLITGEPPPPKGAGVVSLYSREYFALVRQRLAPGGVVTYWLPVDQLEGREARAIVRGFCDVFEDCSLWTGVATAWMLAGSRGPLPPVSEEDVSAQWRDPRVAPELSAVGFDTPELLLATFLADAPFLKRLVGGTPPLVDDAPLRLGPAPPQRPDPLYAELMDVAGARRRFAESDSMRRLWPEALRERTLAAFEIQGLVSRRFVDDVPRPMYAEVAPLLSGPPRLEALTLWLLDSDRDEQRLARAAAGRGVDDALLDYKLGVGSLVARDPAAAERHFARALARDPGQGLLARSLALALCLAGRQDEAVAATADQTMREWLTRSCADRDVTARVTPEQPTRRGPPVPNVPSLVPRIERIATPAARCPSARTLAWAPAGDEEEPPKLARVRRLAHGASGMRTRTPRSGTPRAR